jgi:hypothetical protein
MIAVVNDANILIDLIDLDLVDQFFKLDWEFHCTDLIIDNELYEEQKAMLIPYIAKGKLIIQKVTDEDLLVIIKMQIISKRLSDKDCSALLFAQKLKASLITSDNVLRNCAKDYQIDVHRHLWVFDALVRHRIISPINAIGKLNELNRRNPKLKIPERDCEERIKTWSQMKL